MLMRTGEEGRGGSLLATLKLAPLSSTASSPLDRKWQRIMPHSPAASPRQPSPPLQTDTDSTMPRLALHALRHLFPLP